MRGPHTQVEQRLVNWPSQGFYTRTPLNGVGDLRGVKLRSYNAITVRMAELMGAVPVTVQVAEVAQAFATNIIGAMFTSAQTGVDTSAWDYARIFTDVGGMRARNVVLVNARAMATLDPEARTVLRDAAARAAERGLAAAQAAERSAAERLAEKGMVVATPSAAFMAELREVGARQVQDWVAKAGPEGQQMIERYRAALGR